MKLKVNEKEYTIKFKFRAMYDSEFITEMFNTFNDMDSKDDNNNFEFIAQLAPKTTNMLLVGLQEEHSDEFKTFDDAMNLIKNYFSENEDNQDVNMLGLYTQLINTMSEDGFLEQIGLGEIKKQAKVPQDHKKKTTTQSKK